MDNINEILDNYGYTRDEVKKYLDELRDSGEINMFGAGPYLQDGFGFAKYEAREILTTYMKGGL
jgi:hypothetical protein